MQQKNNPEAQACRVVSGRWRGTGARAHPVTVVQRFFECISEMPATRPVAWQIRQVSLVATLRAV